MVLALVERRPHGQETVHAFANYTDPQTFIAPRFEGTVSYRVEGSEVVLEADGIFNPRADTNLSGTLSVELRAFPVPGAESASSSSTEGVLLAATELGSLGGQTRLPSFEGRAAFHEPSVGRHRIALFLSEWTFASGYVARDRRDFECVYERSAPEPASVSQAEPAIAAPAAARPVERLRLVPPVATESLVVMAPVPAVPAQAPAAVVTTTAPTLEPSVASAPSVAAASESEVARARIEPTAAPKTAHPAGLVSIQTGTVEELAAVKGLTLKLAKEIIKARPFTSLGDSVRVRGIGEKSLVRLKGQLKL